MGVIHEQPGFDLVVGQFDDDAHLDVVLSDPMSMRVKLLHGGGDGTFSVPTSFDAKAAAAELLSADLNGDGRLDLITVNQPSSLAC